jgi:mRNA-degrading endonuclease RelE of RelBE toxin-antitoxin system
MTYKLEFLPSARKEWDKPGRTLREQFKKNWQSDLSFREYRQIHYMGCLTATTSS